MQSVLFIYPTKESLPEFLEIQKEYHVIFYKLKDRQTFIHDMKTDPHYQDVEAIYGGYPGFYVFGGLEGKDIINALPPKLKLITLCSTGYNGNDLEALRARGVSLCNTPNFGAPQVAETAVWHVLSGYRKLALYVSMLRKKRNFIGARTFMQEYTQFDSETGKYNDITDPAELAKADPWFALGERVARDQYVHSPAGKTVVIAGFGGIGGHVARTLNALGMKIRSFQRSPPPETGFPVEPFTDIVEACTGADTIVLCLPATPETDGLVNKKVFEVMNPGSILVNVGRGSLVVNDDLLEALQSGKVAHAGLDVIDGEPNVDDRFLFREDVTITPHMGPCTEEVFDATSGYCLRNIAAVLRGEQPKSVRN